MNFIQKIINFFKSLFGGKNKKAPQKRSTTPVSKPTPKPAPTPTPRPEAPQQKKPEVTTIPELTISDEVMGQKLYLGHFDKNAISKETITPLLKQYHKRINESLSEKNTKLRNGDTFSWVDLKPLAGNCVQTLQTFLVNTGIFPKSAKVDGFFGYATQAGVRLFQEYERTHGNNPKSIPNGVVDTDTWKTMREWQLKKKKAEKWTRGKPSAEFNKWIRMLENGRMHYLRESNYVVDSIIKKVDELNSSSGKPVDTFKIQDWKFDPKEVHLIGIRRNEDTEGTLRKNDDLFILLINGMVFKFWGSTDPNQKYSKRSDEPFLVEGQHKFRFGWHKISNQQKLYQGLNPYERGVLVFRDDKRINDNKLTEADILKGIDNSPNTTINIHWSGVGEGRSGTWSSGCQVMASKNYIDNDGNKQDCSSFLVGTYGEGGDQNENNITKTLAAYNMFTDLILCFRPKNVDYIYYTLARDENLVIDEVVAQGGDQIVSDSLSVFKIPQ